MNELTQQRLRRGVFTSIKEPTHAPGLWVTH
jgi:hypothetical protein